MPPIFLAYHHPAGEIRFAPLDTANEPIFYLPARVEDEVVLETTRPPGRNDVAQIDVISSFPFLSAYGKETCQLLIDGLEIPIITSTETLQRSVLLRDGEQFETSAGRWSIQRDDEQGTIQNSMRPPPLPEQPVEGDLDPMPVPEEKTVPLQDTTHIVPEQDSGLVDDVPFSDAPAFDKDSLRESHRQNLNDSFKLFHDSSSNTLTSATQSTSTSYDESTEGSSDGSVNARFMEDPEHVIVDTSPQKQKRNSSNNEERHSKRNKPNKRRVRFSDEDEQIQAEKTIIIAVAATVERPDHDPSPAIEPKRGRSKKTATPALTGAPGDPAHHPATPSPPASSLKSTASSRFTSTTESTVGGLKRAPVVYFASNTVIDERKRTMKTFRDLGGKKTTFIGEASVLCVVDGHLIKSEALLVAIAQGTDIVTEKWVIEAHRSRRFPDPSRFLPTDEKHEREWGFRIKDAVQRGKAGLTHLLAGTTVFLTAKFRTDMGKTCTQGITNIATALGAEAVKPLPRNGKKAQTAGIAIGVLNDLEAAEVGRQGMELYDKGLLTNAILNGQLDLNSEEYAINIPIKDETED